MVPGIGTIHGFLGEQPGERDLSGCRLLSCSDLAKQIDQGLFALRASGVKRGNVFRKSVLSNFVVVVDLSGEESLAQRAERDEPDPEFLEHRQCTSASGLSRPQRVFALQCCDRLDRMGAADRLRSRFRKAEVLHLAFLDEFLHRSRHIFDRHVGIDAVLIEEIDGIDPEPLERGLSDLA